jgi:hypothetical protein
MGELVEGRGRFTDQIIQCSWYYSEQPGGDGSAHLGPQKAGEGLPDINDSCRRPCVCEVASNLAWTFYFFKDEFDKTHPFISKRVIQELKRKVLIPLL